MRRLLKNELMKIKYSKMFWVLCGGTLIYALLMGGTPEGTMGWAEHGVMASFGYLRSCGTMVMMILSPMVGIFFTRELQQGTMHNTLSCGVDRRRYFAVKTVCILTVGLLYYLSSVLVYALVKCVAVGLRPSGAYPPCGPGTTAVYQLGCCVQTIVYMAFFILISVLVRKTAVVNLAGIVVWFAEAALSLSVPAFQGPTATIISSFELWEEGKVLTLEFVKQYAQCAVMIAVFLTLAYFIFLKRDVN